MISAIILAAGESSRMGGAKQLLPFGESTILGEVIKNTSESKVDEIIVVLGYQAEKIFPKIIKNPVKIALNQNFGQGISSSIKKGLNRVSNSSDAVIIVLGDQPLIGKEVINRLIKTFYESRQGIIVPFYKDIRGHPVIFNTKYKADLLSLEGDIGGKKIIEAYPKDVLKVKFDLEGIISDINDEDDYWLELEKFSFQKR